MKSLSGLLHEQKFLKDPKRSARLKYNRRRERLAIEMEKMKLAAEHVLAQPGSIYKRSEIRALLAAMKRFVSAARLTPQRVDPIPAKNQSYQRRKNSRQTIGSARTNGEKR